MSKTSSVRFVFFLLVAALVWVALVAADFGVLAQNTNSSTTEEETGVQNMNANMEHHRPRRRGRRRGRRRAPRATPAAAEASGGEAGATGGETQADLSGTYTGTVNCLGLSGDGTLTVTGNQFTLESGGTTKSGRITGVTTRGYTGIALRVDDGSTPTPGVAPPPPTIVSARARHHGDRLTITPVPNEPNACSFTPAGGGGPRHHRRRRGRRGRD